MMQIDLQKNPWIVIAVTAVVGIALILIADQLLPDYKDVGAFLAFGLLGAAFCWVYAKNRERLWWAIIPGLGLFSALAAVVVAALTTRNENESSWLGVLVFGGGAVIIGEVLKRADAKFVLYAVALIIFITGVAMIPVTWAIRGILIATVVLGVGFRLLRLSRKLGS